MDEGIIKCYRCGRAIARGKPGVMVKCIVNCSDLLIDGRPMIRGSDDR